MSGKMRLREINFIKKKGDQPFSAVKFHYKTESLETEI